MQTHDVHEIARRIAVAFAYFASGFTLKEFLSFGIRKLHMWWERRIDDRLVAYLVRERTANPSVQDARGDYSTPYYRSSIEIAKAIRRSAVDVRKRLDRLETENRVERPGRVADVWTASKYALHDSN
jgi:hypothetical protein